ncbi:lysophospholipid acyltransferase family protein [Blastochloris sulfoviridis]|uniref:Lysophospholipid acyltransferase family protein n=1 Tax=Blastochloris sulfoviridis TaxID=50712 RepID=A0A5M6HN39_9HYPH|nr:lysophospholipid acyltransferase family protein [Blastochloris sulfoviridis]KAA5597260.1 lysophospholipid acyltransferase family protein [Blastochloris sulfoviridis]
MWKRLARSPAFRRAAGAFLAGYLRLVARTARPVWEPLDVYDRLGPDLPIILTFWHGQHFLSPFVMRPGMKAKVLVSRHADGDINAIAAERFGVGTIRGSGDHKGRFHRKGGVSAFLEMVDSLADGFNIAVTADVPKISRKAGLGVVMLARASGRPIYPLAIESSRRIVLPSWDKASVDLPFARLAFVVGDPIRISPESDDTELEACRRLLQDRLEAAHQRAAELTGRGPR